MGGTLAGKTIASTYQDLLTINSSSDNDGITSTLRKIEDGDGTDTSISLSTVALAVDATDKLYFDGGDNTYVFESAADRLDFYAGGQFMMRLDQNSGADSIRMQCDALVIEDTTGTNPRLQIESDSRDQTASGDSGAVYTGHGIRMGGNDWAYGSLNIGVHTTDLWFNGTHSSPNELFHPVEINGSKVTFNGNTSSKYGIGVFAPHNFVEIAPIHYATGTAYQSANTITGDGTTWTDAMVGNHFVFADGTDGGIITARASNTSITSDISQTVGDSGNKQKYKIHHCGLHMSTSYRKVGLGTADPITHVHIQGRYDQDVGFMLMGYGNGDAVLSIDAGAVGRDSAMHFGCTGDSSEGRFFYNHAEAIGDQYFSFVTGDAAKTPMRLRGDGSVGINKTATPLAQLHVVGADATSEPVLRVEQLDTDQAFIRFEGTTASDATTSTSTATTTSASIVRQVRVQYDGGGTGWIRIYDGVS